jgi:pimeloyl-ACP methyl ester carboxylesterase
MSACDELFLDIHGVRTRVLRGGDGPPLVYWHGAGAADLWFPHHALLAEHFTVYAVNHPGYGGSDNAEWMDSIQDYVLHHDSVFRALGLERPALIGHSLGGWMAATFAATYPDRLSALVLVNAAGIPFDDEPVPDFFAYAARGGLAFASILFHRMEVAAAFFPPNPTPEQIMGGFRELTTTARLCWHTWFDEKMPRRLARIMTPTLVLWGEQEKLFPPALGSRYADGIPGAQFQLLSDCGHMAPFEDPAAFAGAIVRFTSGLQ